MIRIFTFIALTTLLHPAAHAWGLRDEFHKRTGIPDPIDNGREAAEAIKKRAEQARRDAEATRKRIEEEKRKALERVTGAKPPQNPLDQIKGDAAKTVDSALVLAEKARKKAIAEARAIVTEQAKAAQTELQLRGRQINSKWNKAVSKPLEKWFEQNISKPVATSTDRNRKTYGFISRAKSCGATTCYSEYLRDKRIKEEKKKKDKELAAYKKNRLQQVATDQKEQDEKNKKERIDGLHEQDELAVQNLLTNSDFRRRFTEAEIMVAQIRETRAHKTQVEYRRAAPPTPTVLSHMKSILNSILALAANQNGENDDQLLAAYGRLEKELIEVAEAHNKSYYEVYKELLQTTSEPELAQLENFHNRLGQSIGEDSVNDEIELETAIGELKALGEDTSKYELEARAAT